MMLADGVITGEQRPVTAASVSTCWTHADTAGLKTATIKADQTAATPHTLLGEPLQKKRLVAAKILDEF